MPSTEGSSEPISRGESILVAGTGFLRTSSVAEAENIRSESLRPDLECFELVPSAFEVEAEVEFERDCEVDGGEEG